MTNSPPMMNGIAIVYNEYPPIIDRIVEVFPMAKKGDVVFAFGDKIYVPSGKPLTHELQCHESVHCERQKEIGVDVWWQKYLTDLTFRLHEEVLAHRAEYRSICFQYPSRDDRRRGLLHVAKKLTSPLYGRMISMEKAKKELKL